eukprot:NODE_1210_length_1783_cov_0.026128.p1 type:complete len:267 gc:universal NODE_1210_length_1783_cov_0.026128:202-1002(+)
MSQAGDEPGLAAKLAKMTVAQVNEMLDELDEELGPWTDGETASMLFSPATLHMYANARMDEAAEADWGLPAPSKAAKRARKKARVAASTIEQPGGAIPPSRADESSEAVTEPRRKRTLNEQSHVLVSQRAEGHPLTPAALSREAFIELQQRDAFRQAIARTLREGTLPQDGELALHLMMNRDWYCLEEDGLLVHLATSHPKRGTVLRQWYVPTALRALVMRLGLALLTCESLSAFTGLRWAMMYAPTSPSAWHVCSVRKRPLARPS